LAYKADEMGEAVVDVEFEVGIVLARILQGLKSVHATKT
jgi:hypothetical protein